MAVAALASDLQQRDLAVPAAPSTAVIAGHIVDDQQPPHPVRRVVVTVTGEGLRPNRGAITDDDGRFVIRDLPPGRFTVMAERGGYVTSAYGAKRAGRPGTDLSLAVGQTIADLEIRLWRGAAISGLLRDRTGAPLRNTIVEVVPIREITTTGLTLSNRGRAMTDNLGEFRTFGLAPGTYLVRATASQTGTTELVSSENDIDAVFAALAARSSQASAAPRSMARVQVPAIAVKGAAIYFPGTPSVAEATPVTLKAGEGRSGVDFSVDQIRTAAVRGAVALPRASSSGTAFVVLAPVPPPITLLGLTPLPFSRDTGADGRFELDGVPPGDYRFLVRAGIAGADSTGARFGWASDLLHVTGADIDLGTVALQPGLTFSGRITVEAPDEAGPRPPDFTALRVTLQSSLLANASNRSRSGGAPGSSTLQPALVRVDGAFDAADLVPDEYRLIVAGLETSDTTWWLRSALWNGRDLLEEPFRIEPGRDIRGVTLVLSNRHTELSGTLTTTAGLVGSNVFVLAFPAESALRLPGSRRVKAVRPDSNGHFVIANLPAGHYFLSVLTDVDEGEWNDPGFFDSLLPTVVPFTLTDGEKKVQNLRLSGGE